MRGAGVGVGALALVATLSASGLGDAGAAKRHGPDLVVPKRPAVPKLLAPGLKATVRHAVKNAGRARARRSVVRYYLSLDTKRDKLDLRLTGKRRVRALKAGKKSRGRTAVVVPTRAALGRYRMLACADAGRRVREIRERNNCRASRALAVHPQPSKPDAPASRPTDSPLEPGESPVVPEESPVESEAPPPPGADTDGDGTPDEFDSDDDNDGTADHNDCAARDPAVSPTAPDAPGGDYADTNCDQVDGSASQAIFVSPLGSDTSPGTREQPKRTVNDAAVTAKNEGIKSVYVAVGTYDETLVVVDGVSVYGGYGTDWTRARTGVTRLAGDPDGPSIRYTAGAFASEIYERTELQQVTLAPRAPAEPGSTSYGVVASRARGLVLDNVVATGAPATPGAPGADGRWAARGSAGAPCNEWGNAGPGGASEAGTPGGNGGQGGDTADWTAWDGDAGEPGHPGGGPGGGAGGPGGAKGDPGQPGGAGEVGLSGALGADGKGGSSGFADALWVTKFGTSGTPGGYGSGGGGGGGGGQSLSGLNSRGRGGGGGGGGGDGGGAGKGGQGGGGSFGVYITSSDGVVIRNSQLTASSGGAGGRGGRGRPGAAGGPGGEGCDGRDGTDGWEAAGGDGGAGGGGGPGGAGGGGAGGPSVALYLGPAATVTGENNTLVFGEGGAGGAGPHGTVGTSGSQGYAGATNPAPKPKPGF